MNQPIQTIVADATLLKEFITEAVTQAVENAMPAAIRRSKHKEWLTQLGRITHGALRPPGSEARDTGGPAPCSVRGS